MVPKYVFFTKGVGRAKEKLEAFEAALRNAGIEKCNLVSVSSILPPRCKIITKKVGLRKLKPGQIVYVVMARNDTNEPNRLVAAAVGAAIPKDNNHYGYLSEHHSTGQKEKQAGDYAEDLAATMLASTLGIKFDLERAWDEKKEIFKMSGKIVKTRNISQATTGSKNKWTSVIAAAVFIL